MTPKPDKKKPVKRNIIIATGVFVVMGGLVVATMVAQSAPDADTEEKFSIAKLRAENAGPGQMRQAFREMMRNDELTDEQRRKAAREMRGARRSEMMERVQEYFDAAEEDKNVVLDDHIAAFQRRMAEWEKRRAEEDRERPTEEERQAMRNLFRNRSQAERKADSESRNPDQTAQTMAYFTALRGRMSERGISMPRRGGPGGRGGWGGGGGRGGGGGGRGGGGRRP